ncbi:MAG: hypothetical protein DRJ03_01045 [Chloroflexi bacterium]|nr:MAG: hypothetical protein DRJ03_01045 [Chloroflexota bacterium]
MPKTVKGFLTKKQPRALKPKSTTNKKAKDPCEVCGLYKTCNSPKMEYSGEGRKKILVIPEAPGREEDLRNTQLVGEAGQLLETELAELGISLHEDCWKINTVNCRPPKNRTPSGKEIKCCKPRVDKVIEELKPTYIMLMGGVSMQSFYLNRFKNNTVARWRHLCIPDHKVKAWVLPLIHPSYVLRNEWDDLVKTVYRRDLKYAVSCIRKHKEPPVPEDHEQYITIITEFKALKQALQRVKRMINKVITLDFETTGKKPYKPGHRILVASIGLATNKTIAFPVSYPNHFTEAQVKWIKGALAEIMINPKIKKAAHNLPFENMWSNKIIGQVNGWHWCTMNGAHVLDSRKYYSGLKYQAYIHFGVDGYEDEIEPLMKKTHPGTYFNLLDTVPLEKLLMYVGLDSHFCRRLYDIQRRILTRKKDSRGKAFKLIRQGLLALADATEHGVPIDEIYYSEMDRDLTAKLEEIDNKIFTSKYVKQFEKQLGRKFEIKTKDFSSKDIRDMFFTVLKKKPKKKTKSGLDAVDKNVLLGMKHPLATLINNRRKTHKLLNTYVRGYLDENDNGLLHPFFHLHTVRTYRSSSSEPNLQNVQKRDEEGAKICRRGIRASMGNHILCVDYASMEIRILACYSKDPVLIDYIIQDGDPHGDEAKEIFMLPDEFLTKPIRQAMKSGFVFAEVYGSYYKSCAKTLWVEAMPLKMANGVRIQDHMEKELFRGFPKNQWPQVFENHVKTHEDRFWNKYHYTREWQMKTLHDYQKTGKIEFYTGFQCPELLTRNQIFNTPIQGSAFHCLLWSHIRLNKRSKANNWLSQLMAEIHDEIMWDMHPDEREMVVEQSDSVMTKEIREHWPWIIVPLECEPEITDIGASWYYKKDYTKWLRAVNE